MRYHGQRQIQDDFRRKWTCECSLLSRIIQLTSVRRKRMWGRWPLAATTRLRASRLPRSSTLPAPPPVAALAAPPLPLPPAAAAQRATRTTGPAAASTGCLCRTAGALQSTKCTWHCWSCQSARGRGSTVRSARRWWWPRRRRCASPRPLTSRPCSAKPSSKGWRRGRWRRRPTKPSAAAAAGHGCTAPPSTASSTCNASQSAALAAALAAAVSPRGVAGDVHGAGGGAGPPGTAARPRPRHRLRQNVHARRTARRLRRCRGSASAVGPFGDRCGEPACRVRLAVARRRLRVAAGLPRRHRAPKA